MRDAASAEFEQLCFRGLRAGLQDDQSFRHFTPLRIRNGNNGDLVDAGMGEKCFLHLQRRNIFAAADDDFFFAVDDEEVAILIESWPYRRCETIRRAWLRR